MLYRYDQSYFGLIGSVWDLVKDASQASLHAPVQYRLVLQLDQNLIHKLTTVTIQMTTGRLQKLIR